MSISRTIVGLDPSGDRLALAAVRLGLGGASPIATAVAAPHRGDRGPGFMEQAEAALSEFVARHNLAGSGARLYVPAPQVYTARVSFPLLKDRDLRQALELELERLFPFPAARLRFAWQKGPQAGGERKTLVTVAATPSEYLDRWEECISRAGLELLGAVPAGWALLSACGRIGGPSPGTVAALL